MTTTLRIVLVAAALVAAATHASADSRRTARAPLPPVYVEECGTCHVAYPARFLGASSWVALLDGLGTHFGTDATLDPATLEEIRAYLVGGARRRATDSASGEPLLRISETGWFRHEHGGRRARWLAHPEVRSWANCGACHREAEAGRYGESSLELPKTPFPSPAAAPDAPGEPK